MPVRRQSQCKEPSNGLTIRKDMASSGAMMAQTYSFTIPQSPGMDIALFRREIQLNSKSSKDRRVPRRPMFRNLGGESPRKRFGRQRAPLCRPFFFARQANLPSTSGLIIFFQHGQQTDSPYSPRNRAAFGNRWRDHRPVPQL